ncbi:MAG: hypothetical protein IKQ77_12425 [Prevotella sp.]|nr:hypothetical protein [Prevotella sp.]
MQKTIKRQIFLLFSALEVMFRVARNVLGVPLSPFLRVCPPYAAMPLRPVLSCHLIETPPISAISLVKGMQNMKLTNLIPLFLGGRNYCRIFVGEK